MEIGIVGLGLIGSSIARAIKANTPHKVTGYDIDPDVVQRALSDGVTDGVTDCGESDVIIIALYAGDTLGYIRDNAAKFRRGCIVTDCCGIKRAIAKDAAEIADRNGFVYVGGHPMAGTERSGYFNGSAEMLKNGYMLLTEENAVLRELYTAIGMKVKITTAEEHDRMIAYTSQLAHVVSGAYVMSDTAKVCKGFSAGSFLDMTRVARLNEKMWTELMSLNRDNLTVELDGLISRLCDYRDALREDDREKLNRLLRDGRLRKEESDVR